MRTPGHRWLLRLTKIQGAAKPTWAQARDEEIP